MYTKAYSFGGNEASLRVKQTFELSEFKLSRFYCIVKMVNTLTQLTVGETGEFANRFTGLKKKRLTGLPVSYTCTLYMYFAQALTIPFVVTSQQPIQQPIPSAYIIICVLDTVKPTKFVPDIYFFPHSLIL